MFKLNAKFDADSLLSSLSYFECDGHTVHMLTQWHLLPPLTSAVKLSLFIHALSVCTPWLSGYIHVAQTILITLTMAGLFPDRPRICLQVGQADYYYSLTCKQNPSVTSLVTETLVD